MIKTLIVDDESLARQELRMLLSFEADLEIVGEAVNGLQAVEQVNQLLPDLLFLDIEMPGLNGFEVVNSISHFPFTVFVTAYDQYAIQAFEANALDYLLKPLSPERVRKTVERVRRALQRGGAPQAANDAIERLLAAMRHQHIASISRIAVQKGQRIMLVSLRDIIYISIEDKLTFVHTKAGRFLINKTLGEFERSFGESGFYRINRATIINLDHLSEIVPWFSGTCRLRLDTGQELQLSRERVQQLKEIVGLSKQSQESSGARPRKDRE